TPPSNETNLSIHQHPSYIVHFPTPIPFNKNQPMLIILHNNPPITNFHPTPILQIPSILPTNTPQKLLLRQIPTFQKTLIHHQLGVQKLLVQPFQ
ncbi:family 4 glycosyl hydrolase, partial [Bacillus pumilus]